MMVLLFYRPPLPPLIAYAKCGIYESSLGFLMTIYVSFLACLQLHLYLSISEEKN